MSDEIKVDYAKLEEMATHCGKVAEALRQTVEKAKKAGGEMTNGALIGTVGDTFNAALTGPFAKSVTQLADKFDEVKDDIKRAMDDMRKADGTAGSAF